MCVSTHAVLVLRACKPIKSISSDCHMYLPATLMKVFFANGCKGSTTSQSKICPRVPQFLHFCQTFIVLSNS